MSESLHRTLDALIDQRAATIEPEKIHLSPYYGEAYAEVVNLAAGPDFNFIFAWGPRLEPYERIVIEVLVYLAREQARQLAIQAMRLGTLREIPVQLYLERVPDSALNRPGEACYRQSLTDLTNLDRKKVYAALKSQQVAAFAIREPANRVHVNGRVITPPARFRVRVDPVPTPEQQIEIRRRIAERLISEQLTGSPAWSPAARPPASPSPAAHAQEAAPLPSDGPSPAPSPERRLQPVEQPPVIAHTETSVASRMDPSLMSVFDTSVKSLIETSASHELISRNGTPRGAVLRSPVTFHQETSSESSRDVPRPDITDRAFRHAAQALQDSVTNQNPTNRNVSESRLRGAGTGSIKHNSLEDWRRTSEDLARCSVKELDDIRSLGYHIQVWNHARKHDKRNGNQVLTDGVFDILRSLAEKSRLGKGPQGKAWTRRTRRWFEDNGVPLTANWSVEPADENEVAEVRAAIASAPFMRNTASDS